MAKASHKPEVGNEAPAINEQEGPVVLKLAIPQELYSDYKDIAEDQNLTVAELILSRLKRCKSHSSIRGLYFPTSQLIQLEQLLQKKPIESPEQAISLLVSAMSFRVGDFEPIQITAQQAKRIYMGAYGGMTPQDKLRAIVTAAISKATSI